MFNIAFIKKYVKLPFSDKFSAIKLKYVKYANNVRLKIVLFSNERKSLYIRR